MDGIPATSAMTKYLEPKAPAVNWPELTSRQIPTRAPGHSRTPPWLPSSRSAKSHSPADLPWHLLHIRHLEFLKERPALLDLEVTMEPDLAGHKSMAMIMRTKSDTVQLSTRWIRRVRRVVQSRWRQSGGSRAEADLVGLQSSSAGRPISVSAIAGQIGRPVPWRKCGGARRMPA